MKQFRKIFLVLGIALLLTACSKSPKQLLSEQLELGQKYLEELDYDDAIVAYKKAIELDPKVEGAYLNLSWILVQQENYKEAIEILNSGLEMIPESAGILEIKERLVPTVSCSVEEGDYSDPVTVKLKSGKKSEIYYSLKSDAENIKETVYEDAIELRKNGEYLLTYYAIGEYGTKGETYEKEIVIELDEDKYPMNQWVQYGDIWYYYDESGTLAVGWTDIDGDRYYFHENGAMAYDTWVEDCYLGSDGAMLRDLWTPDGYYVGPDGKWDKTRDKKKEMIKNLPGLSDYLYAVENYDIVGLNETDYSNSAIDGYGMMDVSEYYGGELIDRGEYYEVTDQVIDTPLYFTWSEIANLKPGDNIYSNSKIETLRNVVVEKEKEYRIFETTSGTQICYEDIFDNGKYIQAIMLYNISPYEQYEGYLRHNPNVFYEAKKVYSGSLYVSKGCEILFDDNRYLLSDVITNQVMVPQYFGDIYGYIMEIDEDGFITLLRQMTWS